MREFILLVTDLVNEIHDILVAMFGMHFTDKELHFWVIGIVGILTFFFVYMFFKLIEKWKFHTTIISFIFTFTGMVVLVFAIEIQQAITNRGEMDFADAVAGLWGFLVFFFVYAVLAGIAYLIIKSLQKKKRK
jgi:uncharacterized BrkB/YihY/UPF0761 family membrane protein